MDIENFMDGNILNGDPISYKKFEKSYKIKEEINKQKITVYYLREEKHIPGKTYQATATNLEGIGFHLKQLYESHLRYVINIFMMGFVYNVIYFKAIGALPEDYKIVKNKEET